MEYALQDVIPSTGNRTGAAASPEGAEAMARAAGALSPPVPIDTSACKRGTDFVDPDEEGESSLDYRGAVNADGSPSETVSATYAWTPGTELMRA